MALEHISDLSVDKIDTRLASCHCQDRQRGGNVPALPWITVREPAPATEVVVMASRFRVKGYRHVMPFFLDSQRVLTQIRRADGALGLSLVIRPLRCEFF